MSSTTVTLSQVDKEAASSLPSPAVPSKQLAPPLADAHKSLAFALGTLLDTGLCLSLTLLSPVVLLAVFALGLAKTCMEAFRSGSWYC